MKHRFHISFSSNNVATGNMLVTTTSRSSCPPACPLKGGRGCYAENHGIVYHWDALSRGEKGYIAKDFFSILEAVLQPNQLWRHNQAGDMPGEHNRLDDDLSRKIALANNRRQAHGFTYTHYKIFEVVGETPETTTTAEDAAHNLKTMRAINRKAFTANLSCDNLAEVDRARAVDRRLPLVVTIPSKANPKHGGPRTFRTPAGHRVVVCPKTYRDMTCIDCKGLCWRKDRDCVIAFPAHGSKAKIVDRRLELEEQMRIIK